MKRIPLVLLALLVSIHLAVPAGAEADKNTKKAIEQAALDYMDGAHSGDAVRIEKAIHPELTKVSVRKMKTGHDALRKTGYTALIEMVRANVAPVPKEERDIKIEIFTVREGLAGVKVTSSMFYDYILLAGVGGEWKLINVLWKMNPEWTKKNRPGSLEGKPPFDAAAEKKAIEAAALDYLEGYYTGDAERMARGIHTELTKVWPKPVQKTGRVMLQKIGASYLTEITRAKSGILDEDKRKIEMTILDYDDEIAMVELLSAMFFDYLQLAKIDGEWKIINVLWTMNPDAPKPER